MLLLIVLFLIFDILIVMCLGMGHKISLNKFKRREIISIIFFPNCNSMKLKINCIKKLEKNHKYVETEQYTTEQLWTQSRILKIPGDK